MKIRLLILAALCAAFAVAPSAAQAKTPTAPPPITLPPTAGEAQPPADAIVSSNQPAQCSGWYLTGTFGGRWATGSTWWEYACRRTGMSDESSDDWTDFYFYDGSRSVYYGEWWTAPLMSWDYAGCSYWIDVATSRSYGPYACSAEWNDAPVAGFTFECSGLSCTFDGTASSDSDGTIVEYVWNFADGTDAVYGATVEHVFAGGWTYGVSLLVTDDVGDAGYTAQSVSVSAGATPVAAFTVECSGLSCSFDGSSSSDTDGTIQTYRWSFGDGAWATGSGHGASHTYSSAGTYSALLAVTDDSGNTAVTTKDIIVTNAAPTAALTLSCSGQTCSFDGSGSSDRDGAIIAYHWSFGDGATGDGATAQHTFAHPGTNTVTLTVTDDDGAIDNVSETVGLIALTARSYKVKGLQKVDLAWTGSTTAGFDLYRSGTKIATVHATAYTDNIYQKGPGRYVYKVCAAQTSVCSNEATVTF